MCFLQKLVAGNVIANRDMSLIPLLKKQFENEFIVLFYRKQTSEWRQFEWIFLFQQFLASLSLACLLKNRWNFVFFLPIYKFYNAQLVKIGWDFKWIWLLPKETSHVFISISSSLGRREKFTEVKCNEVCSEISSFDTSAIYLRFKSYKLRTNLPFHEFQAECNHSLLRLCWYGVSVV